MDKFKAALQQQIARRLDDGFTPEQVRGGILAWSARLLERMRAGEDIGLDAMPDMSTGGYPLMKEIQEELARRNLTRPREDSCQTRPRNTRSTCPPPTEPGSPPSPAPPGTPAPGTPAAPSASTSTGKPKAKKAKPKAPKKANKPAGSEGKP